MIVPDQNPQIGHNNAIQAVGHFHLSHTLRTFVGCLLLSIYMDILHLYSFLSRIHPKFLDSCIMLLEHVQLFPMKLGESLRRELEVWRRLPYCPKIPHWLSQKSILLMVIKSGIKWILFSLRERTLVRVRLSTFLIEDYLSQTHFDSLNEAHFHIQSPVLIRTTFLFEKVVLIRTGP